MQRSKLSLSGTFLAGLLLGIACYAALSKSGITATDAREIRLGQGRYTNPLLECELGSEIVSSTKIDFSAELETFVNGIKRYPGVSRVGVSYRDLNNGPSFGVDRDEPFVPASLLKVPIMMAFFKHAEKDPAILDEKLTYTEKFDTGFVPAIGVPEESELKLGESYAIRNLIDQMITYSDNQAMFLLWGRLSLNELHDLYRLLGVDTKVLDQAGASLSVRQYSTFFRILFNSSFLSQDDSEKSLSLLAGTAFNQGIKAGLPKDIQVAHKFGERRFPGQEMQLHDCGIVYSPKQPYLICIMTAGDNIPVLERAIADISRFVYDRVTKN